MHDGLVAGIEWKDLRELPLPWESLPIYLIASHRASSLPLLRNGKREDKEFASELMDGMWNCGDRACDPFLLGQCRLFPQDTGARS